MSRADPLVKSHREPGADEVVIGGIVQADTGADIPLHIVAQQVGETAVEVVLRLGRISAVRKERKPFGVRSEFVDK